MSQPLLPIAFTRKLSLLGYVTSFCTGQPVAGAQIILELDGSPAALTASRPDGRFHFTKQLAATSVRLIASGPPGLHAPYGTAQAEPVPGGPAYEPLHLALPPATGIYGQVTDGESPVAGVKVTVTYTESLNDGPGRPASQQHRHYTVTNQDGHFCLAQLDVRRIATIDQVQIDKPGYKPVTHSAITLPDQGQRKANHRFDPVFNRKE